MNENKLEVPGEKCKRGQKRSVLEFVGELVIKIQIMKDISLRGKDSEHVE